MGNNKVKISSVRNNHRFFTKNHDSDKLVVTKLKMIKSVLIFYVFIAVVCANLARSLDEGSFKAGAAGRQRRKAWDGEVDAEVKKHIECCLRGYSKSEKEGGFGTWSDTTPEAVFAMPSQFTVKGCPKK